MSSGKKIATLKVATANAMQREGNNQFSAKQLQDAPAGSFRVLQNFRQHSNVNTVGEMVDMLAGMRAYEAAQKSVVAQDSSLEELLSVLRK
jgi:flagellar basal-body rod protein FlgG